MRGILCQTSRNSNGLTSFEYSDTFRNLDDIFTIDNPKCAKHMPDIYPKYFGQRNIFLGSKYKSYW